VCDSPGLYDDLLIITIYGHINPRFYSLLEAATLSRGVEIERLTEALRGVETAREQEVPGLVSRVRELEIDECKVDTNPTAL